MFILTVIVKTPVWLDKPSYRLYKEENILVLRFLRNADGIDDINASTTQQEYIDKYIAKKYGYLEKKSEHQDDDKNESRQNDMTIESQQDSKKIKKIDEGYQKIYQTYIKETDAEYRKDYNAKGYSYIVTYEDETQIRYLMYDRDNQEGTKTQYVYYKKYRWIMEYDGCWNFRYVPVWLRIKRGKGFTKDFLVNLKRDPLNMNSYYISGKPW